jgi:disulfide bond formation protein DsbB
LCVIQRVPYVVTGLMAFVVLASVLPERAKAWLLFACALAFSVGAAIAVFHVGVEHHWWAGLASCEGGGVGRADSVEDLMASLSRPPAPRCDQVQWSLFGLSMAGYNVLASAALAGFALRAGLKRRRAA